MRMTLYESRHQHLVFETLIEPDVAPSLQFREAARSQNTPITHGHMSGLRATGVHGDDFFGTVNDRFGHGSPCNLTVTEKGKEVLLFGKIDLTVPNELFFGGMVS
jgi:hypothetical protein